MFRQRTDVRSSVMPRARAMQGGVFSTFRPRVNVRSRRARENCFGRKFNVGFDFFFDIKSVERGLLATHRQSHT